MAPSIMLYGATGYTGGLTVEAAVKRGEELLLAGRSVAKLRRLAEPLDAEWRAFPLDDVEAVAACIDDVDAVLHMAGPFSATAKPMVDACIASGTHYLDITGEIDVYETLAARDEEAREAGVVLLPGVGFDVVPSDCLAAHVVDRIENPSELDIGVAGFGGAMSQGTAKTMIEGLQFGTVVRRGGELTEVPQGSLRRRFDFGRGEREAVAISWGDVATAYHSTGVADITDYFKLTRQLNYATTVGHYARPLFRLSPVRSGLKWLVERGPEGPSDEQRARGGQILVAEVRNETGQTASSRLRTPDGYSLTVETSLEAARRVADGGVEPGFQTPATAFGADFVLEFDEVSREDL